MAAGVKESPYLLRAGVFATVVASSMMFLRILFEVMVINPALAPSMLAPMIIMGHWVFYWVGYYGKDPQLKKLTQKSKWIIPLPLNQPSYSGSYLLQYYF